MLLPINSDTFAQRFKLGGMKEEEPPGTFSVETHSEDSGAFAQKGNREETTWIRICQTPGINGVLRMVKIDPDDLKKAFEMDADDSRRRSAGQEKREV